MASSSKLKIFHSKELGPISATVDWLDYRIGYFIVKKKAESKNNEDTLFILGENNQLIFGVSDGAGGHPKGDEASELAGQTVLESYENKLISNVRVMDVIETINDKVLGLKAGAYCTFTMATIEKDIFRTFSVGDSELIYWNANSNEVYSNIPHSQVGYSIEAGHLEQGESLDDPDRYVVNNMLGDKAFRIEASSKMELKKGHTILLGSDGIFDNLTHLQLQDIIAKGSFEKSFSDLCELCLHRGEDWKKDDDISFVVVRKIKA